MKTFIDFLKFRFKANPNLDLEVPDEEAPFKAMKAIIKSFGFSYSDLLEVGSKVRGKDGWEFRKPLILAGDQEIAWIDYGGKTQRGWCRFQMRGEGCGWISRWDLMADGLDDLGAEIMRVDVALDFFGGEVSHENVLAAYDAGLFKRREGGRNPKLKKIETSCQTDGRTVYVGSRDSARFIRCYEKGWEMVAKAKVPEWVKANGETVFYFRPGVATKAKDYYRIEVELKDSDGVVVPTRILREPDSFFAGAAPWFETLLDAAPVRTVAPPSDFNAVQLIDSSILHCKRAYGGLFNVLLNRFKREGESIEVTKARVFDALCSDEPSARLVSAGCLSLPVQGIDF